MLCTAREKLARWGVTRVYGSATKLQNRQSLLPIIDASVHISFNAQSTHILLSPSINPYSQQTVSVSDSRPCLIVCLVTTHEVVTRLCSFTFPTIAYIALHMAFTSHIAYKYHH